MAVFGVGAAATAGAGAVNPAHPSAPIPVLGQPLGSNVRVDGGSGTVDTNPAAMKVWKVQSVLTYKVGKRTYAKSRTVLRSQ